MNDIDPQADAVIDKLLKGLEEARVKGAAIQAANQPATPAPVVKPPVLHSALYKKIAERGNLSEKDIMKLVAREVRKGV